MPELELNGIQVEVDEDGFIQDPACWNESLAAAIARA
ncbi:MAG: TusE/DsrC/DsvC family sulfur relay protein, partial [Bacteroidota bacterium]